MSEARWLQGDVFARLADIDDGTVDLVACSPPFWKQRGYLPADHPDKALEIGQEAHPADFIDTLLRLTAEFRRVLAPHGSIAVELGDTSAGSGGAGGDYNPGGFRDGQPKWDGSAKRAGRPAEMTTRKSRRRDGAGGLPTKFDRADDGSGPPIPNLRGKQQPSMKHVRRDDPTGNGWGPLPDMHRGGNPTVDDGPLAKSLCMVPEAYRFALSWGISPFTAAPSPAGRWIVRNVVDWCRPNPTPGDDGDKFRRATSDIVIATLDPKRYWDGEAVREPSSPDTNARTARGVDSRPNDGKVAPESNRDTLAIQHSGDGTRPLYDWWAIAPAQYPGAHYAVWTPEIARRLILSMCPERVCRTCGEPSRRILERGPSPVVNGKGRTDERLGLGSTGERHGTIARSSRTVGRTDCGHGDWRRGHVLDPFGGSGTTAEVATGLGRDCTLIDIDDRNLDLARARVGMFLVESP